MTSEFLAHLKRLNVPMREIFETPQVASLAEKTESVRATANPCAAKSSRSDRRFHIAGCYGLRAWIQRLPAACRARWAS